MLPRNQIILGQYKACEEVTLALTTYVTTESLFVKVISSSASTNGLNNSVDVAIWGCNAVAQLAVNNSDHVALFGSLGGCEAIVRVLQKFPDRSTVVVAACRAMCILLKDFPNHSLKFGNAGACHILVEILISHPGQDQVMHCYVLCSDLLSFD